MGLREIQEGSYQVGESAKADLSSGLREGSWDYASLGAARAVDWSAELSAEPTREEVRASMPAGALPQQPFQPASDGGADAPAVETFNGEPVPERPFDLGVGAQNPAYAGNAAVAIEQPAAYAAATEPAETASAAYEAAGAASAVREVSTAAAAVHAVDAAKTARAEYKSAADVGAAAAVDVASAADGGAAAVTSTGAVKASDALAKPVGQVSAAESALESGARAAKLSKLKSGALKGAGAAAELASGQDIGEGMANVAEGEAKGFAERKAAGWAAKRMNVARTARAARKAAKAAGNAGAAKAGAEAVGSKAAGAAAKAGAAAAAAEPAAQAGLARRAGAKLLAKAQSLFKPLPPISYLAEKTGAVLCGTLPFAVPAIIVAGILSLVMLVCALVVSLGGGDESQNVAGLTDNEAAVATFLRERDVDDTHIAAILANMWAESGVDPSANQVFDWGTCDRLDTSNNRGHGLCQWGNPGRFDALLSYTYAVKGNDEWEDASVQLNYLWYEMTGEDLDGKVASSGAGVQNGFFNWNRFLDLDLEDAVEYYLGKFERGPMASLDKRVEKAKAYYAALAGGSGNSDITSAALTKIGCPYVWGAAGPDEFDCSGLVCWAYAQAGFDLPSMGMRTTYGMYANCTIISKEEAQPGDIILMNFSSPGVPEHVGLYLGGGQMIHAPTFGESVRIENAGWSYSDAVYARLNL